jgi:hypothetical protein
MLFVKLIAVYSDNHTKHINIQQRYRLLKIAGKYNNRYVLKGLTVPTVTPLAEYSDPQNTWCIPLV